VIVYHYSTLLDDRISRLTSIVDGESVLEKYEYLGVGSVVRRAHPETGIDLSYIKLSGESVGDAGDQYTGLDRFGRITDQRWLTAANGVAVDRYQYTYDRNGNRLFETNLLNTSLIETYGYDSLNQLTNFATTGTTKSWDFDALGNWDGVTTNGTTQTRSHNRQNEITAVSGQTTPVFDANGNMTTDETGKEYGYDAWNRLVVVKDSGGNELVRYEYDGHTRRVQEHRGTTNELYYSDQWQVIQEGVLDSDPITYVWSPVYVDAMVARDGDGRFVPSGRVYVTHDANFNVTAITDSSGTVVERYTYDPFGTATVRDAAWTVTTPAYGWQYLHQGGRLNAESGLYSFRYREYSPTLGRWVTIDPMGLNPDINVYRAILNNTLFTHDPLGLDPPNRPGSENEQRNNMYNKYDLFGNRLKNPPPTNCKLQKVYIPIKYINTIVFSTGNTTPTDHEQWATQYKNMKIEHHFIEINSPREIVEKLKSFQDGSILRIIVSGHGVDCGASVNFNSKGADYISAKTIKGQIASDISRKLVGPDAIFEFYTCGSGKDESGVQTLANSLNCIVRAPTVYVTGVDMYGLTHDQDGKQKVIRSECMKYWVERKPTHIQQFFPLMLIK
jgi:RHS repeat-associated protein